MKSMKFPKEYEAPVDLKVIKWEAVKPWIAQRTTELLGMEDEVLISYIFEQLEGKQVSPPPSPLPPPSLPRPAHPHQPAHGLSSMEPSVVLSEARLINQRATRVAKQDMKMLMHAVWTPAED